MIYYNLNMARGFVLPLELRRKWLHWVVLYLLLMAAGIALALNYCVERSAFWRGQSQLVNAQESKLLRKQAGFKSVEDYQLSLEREVSACMRDLDSVLKFGQDHNRIASILLSLIEPLPVGLGLGTVNFEGATRKIVFEVHMPVTLKIHEKISPPKLVALWEKHPVLSQYLKQIEMENSERIRNGAGEVMSWRFSAVIGGPTHE